MSELRPLDDNVIVIPYIQKETNGGIILPSKLVETEVPSVHIVSAVGPNVKNKDIKEGTVVIIPKRTGKWVPFEGFKYVKVNESDILAIIEDATYQKLPEEK